MQTGFDADVIVVGGGISGLCCAWGLQQRGVDGESTEESIFVEVIIKQKPKGGKKDEATT